MPVWHALTGRRQQHQQPSSSSSTQKSAFPFSHIQPAHVLFNSVIFILFLSLRLLPFPHVYSLKAPQSLCPPSVLSQSTRKTGTTAQQGSCVSVSPKSISDRHKSFSPRCFYTSLQLCTNPVGMMGFVSLRVSER